MAGVSDTINRKRRIGASDDECSKPVKPVWTQLNLREHLFAVYVPHSSAIEFGFGTNEFVIDLEEKVRENALTESRARGFKIPSKAKLQEPLYGTFLLPPRLFTSECAPSGHTAADFYASTRMGERVYAGLEERLCEYLQRESNLDEESRGHYLEMLSETKGIRELDNPVHIWSLFCQNYKQTTALEDMFLYVLTGATARNHKGVKVTRSAIGALLSILEAEGRMGLPDAFDEVPLARHQKLDLTWLTADLVCAYVVQEKRGGEPQSPLAPSLHGPRGYSQSVRNVLLEVYNITSLQRFV